MTQITFFTCDLHHGIGLRRKGNEYREPESEVPCNGCGEERIEDVAEHAPRTAANAFGDRDASLETRGRDHQLAFRVAIPLIVANVEGAVVLCAHPRKLARTNAN